MITDYETDLTGRVIGIAKFSDCRRYRYVLTRTWGAGRRIAFCMLNPSTADASQDDPTIGRCIQFAKVWGYSGLIVVNLFALRATDPRELYSHSSPFEAPGDNNAKMIVECSAGLRLIAAWGTHGELKDSGEIIVRYLNKHRSDPVECLGFTKGGYPKHPLYLARDTQPVNFLVEGKLCGV
jgi:hypothetical protein